jgi:fluoride exporter
VSPRAAALIAIAVGGAIGALGRAGLGASLPAIRWPVATLIANLVGTVLLAALAALIAFRPHLPHWLHPLVAVGFCGSLTTFSAMQVEALVLMRAGMSADAILYVATSVLLGLVAAVATRRAVQAVTP